MYEDQTETCEPVVLTLPHSSSQQRWTGPNLSSRPVQLEEITHDPVGSPDYPYTMATDDTCETSKELPGPSRTQSTRSCSLSSQESVKQWLKSVDQDAVSLYPGEYAVSVDDPLTDTEAEDGEMEYPFSGKISRGDGTEDDLTLGSEAKLLDPAVTTVSEGVPPASAVFAGTHCYWLSNHARMSRQARLMQMGESFESYATETSTQTSLSSNSIEGLLQSRTCDPEELLLSLGFGGGRDENRSLRVPERFLQQQSQCGGVDLSQFMARERGQDSAMQGWAGLYECPVSTLYHRRMSTGSIPAYSQHGTYGMTKSTWSSCQPSTDDRQDMTAHSSPLRRSVTVSTGGNNAVVMGEVEDLGVQTLQQPTDKHPGHSASTSTKVQQRRTKRATLVKQRSAESFSLDKDSRLSEDNAAKSHDNRGKMRKRSLSMPHIQCILEPVKEESPHSSLENTLHSKELSEMLQNVREQEFSVGLEETLGRICYSPSDAEDNNWTSIPQTSAGVAGVSPMTQSRDLPDVHVNVQFTMESPGGAAVEEKREAKERIAVVISPDATGVQGLLPKRKTCRLAKVPNVDAESPPEELLLPRSRLTSTPEDTPVCLSVPQQHAACPQESFDMEEIGSTDVSPEEGAWCTHLVRTPGSLPHQNSTQSDSSGFADDSYMGSDPPGLMETVKMEGLGSSAESLASTRSVQTVIHMDTSQGAPIDGDWRQENDVMGFSSYCPMQFAVEIHHDSECPSPENHYVQESITINKDPGKTICHSEDSILGNGNVDVCPSSVPNVALSKIHTGKKRVESGDSYVHCGNFFEDHRVEKCPFQDADLSGCSSEEVLPLFSISDDDGHCEAIVSQGTSLYSAVEMCSRDNTASSGKKAQDTETPIILEGPIDFNIKDYNDDQKSSTDPKFTSQSGCQSAEEDLTHSSEPTHDVSSVGSQPEKSVQTATLQFPAQLSQHFTVVDGILNRLKNSIEKVTSQCHDSDGDQDVKITLQQTTEHLEWPEDVRKNIAPETLHHVRGVPYIDSAGQPVFPVRITSAINVELSQGSPHVCKKYVLVEETKHYTKAEGKEGVKEVAVRRKKEITAPPTTGSRRLGENLPENEKQESGEKVLHNLQLFVEEARGKFLIRREADCEGSDGKSPNVSLQSCPTADKTSGEDLKEGLQEWEKKSHKDNTQCHGESSMMQMEHQSEGGRKRAPSIAEEMNLDIMEPVNRYTAEGIASDLRKTSSEVSITNSPGGTDDLSAAKGHPLQDYWTLAALVMASRHEKLSELQLGPPGNYDLHYTFPKQHLIQEVSLACCCVAQYRGQLVQLELLFTQCYAAFYSHMTAQERLEVEWLVLLRAEVLREAEELETMLASHLQAVRTEDSAVFLADKPPSSMTKLQLLGQLIELLKEQGQMQQALAFLVQTPATQHNVCTPALPAPPMDTPKHGELLVTDREQLQREVREIREELSTEREDRQRDMDKNLHRLRLSIMADVRQEIAEQMKLLRLQLQAKEEEVRMLRLQMKQQTKTQRDEGEGGSQRAKKSIRVTQL
ncbi:uncharacterized protein LOC118405365 isoform X3 [Branchiostoma floridae]|uniref:Uncharacterized protein LOC118405365 isoform X3 n=1 Tax=Branchiostoma floridae TaxID=7739 RepID=A0A9J7HLX0_BRAFL|nr:uncharacterized protein LOC118405365 isoform X3 [Branchiostoma floridae]